MDDYSVPKKMKQIGDLFERYRTRIKAPQASVEKVCVEVINEVTGYSVTLKQVTYTVSTRTLSIQVPSILKSELKFHYSEILRILKTRLGADGSPKVIL
ncbi:MAG: hypothetical protein RLZZ230_232 [Candidatus Parcubacteria bacterium]|jgi:hypothetical protein